MGNYHNELNHFLKVMADSLGYDTNATVSRMQNIARSMVVEALVKKLGDFMSGVLLVMPQTVAID